MKSCNYFYKGRLIGDIIALDDFLLTNQKYYANVSDRVFQEARTIDSAKVNRISETLKKAKKEKAPKSNSSGASSNANRVSVRRERR